MPGFLGGSSGSSGTSGEIRFPAELIDPVTKLRVSQPQTMMDTDFEYGLQPTKWETVELINNTPSFFSASGDTTIPNLLDLTTTTDSREIKVTTSLPHGLAVGIPLNISGSKSLTADGAYIINSVPDSTTFTYLSKQNQLVTASIIDLYTSVITGQFFQGSQIKIADSDGIVTNASSVSTLTVKTDSPHGFGVNTPFYFLNLNSTVSQEFDASNTGSKTFDASNTATAQSFDGSNTLTSYSIDLNNKAVTSGTISSVVSTNTSSDTVTVTHTSENFLNKTVGTPLYHNVSAASGYFSTTPRGIVYLASSNLLGANSSEFQISLTPGGAVLDLTVTLTGTFQLANNAVNFAGNNTDSLEQRIVAVSEGTAKTFDGTNTSGSVSSSLSVSNGSAIIQMTNNAGSSVSPGLYVGSMVRFDNSAGGSAPGGLTTATTYWITYINVVVNVAPGLVQVKLAATPGGADIVISSQGTGTTTATIKQIGVSTDKDIFHVPQHGFTNGDMIKYAYPAGGAVTMANRTSDYVYVGTVYDVNNFSIDLTPGISATGGTVTTISDGGISYKLHSFTTAGASSFVVSGAGTVEVLVVGGGGGGAGAFAGGGGAGGVVYSASYPVSGGTYAVTVGNGGAGGYAWYNTTAHPNGMGGVTGEDSSFGPLIAKGGGGGGQFGGPGSYDPLTPAKTGGSGGGGGSWHSSTGDGTYTGGGWQGAASNQASFANAVSYGSTGGSGWNGYPGGGGGGAGGIGGNGNPSNYGNTGATGGPGGNGGPGRAFGITGTSVFYAGGGGGSSQSTGFGTGGTGGGGNGKSTNAANQEELKGTDGLGGGGGASGWPGNSGVEGTRVGGRGGRGVVYVRYKG